MLANSKVVVVVVSFGRSRGKASFGSIAGGSPVVAGSLARSSALIGAERRRRWRRRWRRRRRRRRAEGKFVASTFAQFASSDGGISNLQLCRPPVSEQASERAPFELARRLDCSRRRGQQSMISSSAELAAAAATTPVGWDQSASACSTRNSRLETAASDKGSRGGDDDDAFVRSNVDIRAPLRQKRPPSSLLRRPLFNNSLAREREREKSCVRRFGRRPK